MPIRTEFPEAGTDYLGGKSDGWEYSTVFSGTSLQASYDMLKAFLEEEGYEDIPLPSNANELDLFRHPKKGVQLSFFAEGGYVHNPIKIKFHQHRRKRNILILHLYNEALEDHLLRFHRVV